jgi:hypothetical protein
MDDETMKLFKFLSRGNKIKIYPGSQLPANARFQVCVNHPVPGGNQHEAVCSKCAQPIFYQDQHPHLTKICVTCFLKLAKNEAVESVGNMDSIIRAALVRKRN